MLVQRVRDRNPFGSAKGVRRIVLSVVLSGILIISLSGCSFLDMMTTSPDEPAVEEAAVIDLSKVTEDSCFSWDNTAIVGLTETGQGIQNLVIPAKATEIRGSAFSGNTVLRTVGFLNANIKLGSAVFSDCSALEKVELPANLQEISVSLFKGCIVLKEVALPNQVTAIGDMAFYQCVSLEKATHGDALATIGRQAFHTCDKLKEFDFTAGITEMGEGAFAWCNRMESAILTKTQIKTLTERCFSNCDLLIRAELPEGLETMDKGVFTQCPKLVTVRLPESLADIEATAFKNTENKNAEPKKFLVIQGSYADTNFSTYADEQDIREYYTVN